MNRVTRAGRGLPCWQTITTGPSPAGSPCWRHGSMSHVECLGFISVCFKEFFKHLDIAICFTYFNIFIMNINKYNERKLVLVESEFIKFVICTEYVILKLHCTSFRCHAQWRNFKHPDKKLAVEISGKLMCLNLKDSNYQLIFVNFLFQSTRTFLIPPTYTIYDVEGVHTDTVLNYTAIDVLNVNVTSTLLDLYNMTKDKWTADYYRQEDRYGLVLQQLVLSLYWEIIHYYLFTWSFSAVLKSWDSFCFMSGMVVQNINPKLFKNINIRCCSDYTIIY